MTPRVSAAKVQNIHSLANTPEEGGRVGLTGAGNAACTGNTTLAGTELQHNRSRHCFYQHFQGGTGSGKRTI